MLITHTREADAKNAQRQIYGGGGIIGASDGNWTIVEIDQTETEKRARPSMTNRDIESNDIDLVLNKQTLLWNCIVQPNYGPILSKDELILAVLIAMFADKQSWKGTATELLTEMRTYCDEGQNLQLAPNTLSRWFNDSAHQELLFRHARLRFASGYKTIILTNEAYFLPINDTNENIDGFLPDSQK